MLVHVNVKSIGRRLPIIEKVSYEVTNNIKSSNDLLKEIIKQNVREFNKKETDKVIFKYLTNQELENKEVTGKIDFKDKKNDAKQDEAKAIENALLSYYDGIFKIYLNDEEIMYDQRIELREGDVLTFIRLTMLAGGMWY